MLVPIRKLFILAFSVAILACSKGRDNRGGGVVDGGGGGDFVFSSQEEVNSAVDKAWQMFTDDGLTNIMLKALTVFTVKELEQTVLKDGSALTEKETQVQKILMKALNLPRPKRAGDESLFVNPNEPLDIQYLKQKKLNLPANELCSGPHDHKYLASVSKLNREGEVCISIHGLMRHPTGSLKTDVLALIAHEIAHLNGFGENEARLVQKHFLTHMQKILRKDGETARLQILHAFKNKLIYRWPELVTYEVVDEAYLKGVVQLSALFFATFMERPMVAADGLLFKFSRLSDDVEIAKPEMEGQLRQTIQALYHRTLEFADPLAEAYSRGERQQLTPQQMKDVSAIASAMIDLYKQAELYLRGKNLDIWIDKEREWIAKATAPETLTNPGLRPQLFCPLPKAPNLRYLHSLAPMYDQKFRCQYGTNNPSFDGIL